MTFGTIAIEVKTSDTIAMVRKRLRVRLDFLFRGRDVEVPAAIESHHTITYEGKNLDEQVTLGYYKIDKGARLVATSGLAGEGKRVRAGGDGEEEQLASGGAIPDMSSVSVPTSNDDSKATIDASNYVVDILQWVGDLSTEKHAALKDMVNMNLKYLTADNTLRKYATLIPEIEALEVVQQAK